MSFRPPFEIGTMWSRVIAVVQPAGTGTSSQCRLQPGHVAYRTFRASHSAVVNVPSAAANRARRRWANTFTLHALQAEKYVAFDRCVKEAFGSSRRQR